MSDDQRAMLVSAVGEFCAKTIEPASALIEREGISADLVSKIGSQGFIGLQFSEENGGSNIDPITYLLMLKEFARFSPSVALLIAVQNRVSNPLLSATEGGADLLKAISTGRRTAGVALSSSSMKGESIGSLSIEKGSLTGVKNYVLSPSSDCIIAVTDDKPESIIVTKERIESAEYHVLGFRGLRIGKMNFDKADYLMLQRENGIQKMQQIWESMDLDVAAIALGIADASIQKALDYSKVRSTFGHLLKDYQPVAFSISSILEEANRLTMALNLSGDFDLAARKGLKIRAMDLAVKSSRQSIQTHGGYGYLQDFGVEKFYRDSATLQAVFNDAYSDNMTLANQVYREKSGYM